MESNWLSNKVSTLYRFLEDVDRLKFLDFLERKKIMEKPIILTMTPLWFVVPTIGYILSVVGGIIIFVAFCLSFSIGKV